MKTICLNMIVRNESHIIERCLRAALPIADMVSITDTGSTDDTIDRISAICACNKCEVDFTPWVDFGTCRTIALENAKKLKSDYILFLDSDDIISGEIDKDKLISDIYNIKIRLGEMAFYRPLLVKSESAICWQGAVHEYLQCTGSKSNLSTVEVRSVSDSHRNKNPDKFLVDVQLLKKSLDKKRNARDLFYLAQSYRDAGFPAEAIRYYEERSRTSGWSEETWYSIYQVGWCYSILGKERKAREWFLRAFEFNPRRAEPLYHLACIYAKHEQFQSAKIFLDRALKIKKPHGNSLFVHESLYDWRIADEFMVACSFTGDYDDADLIGELLSSNSEVPEAERTRIKENCEMVRERLKVVRENGSAQVLAP